MKKPTKSMDLGEVLILLLFFNRIYVFRLLLSLQWSDRPLLGRHGDHLHQLDVDLPVLAAPPGSSS